VFWLRQQIVIQRVGSSILLYQEDLGCALDGVNKFGDDRMVELGEDVDLPFKVAQFVGLV